MGKSWIKLWTEVNHDRKLRRLDMAARCCWFQLCALVGEYDEGGRTGRLESPDIGPLTDADIIDEIAADDETWQRAKAYFLTHGMITIEDGVIILINYGKRQEPLDKTGAERAARYRENHIENNRRDEPTIMEESNSVTNGVINDRGQSTDTEYIIQSTEEEKSSGADAPPLPSTPESGLCEIEKSTLRNRKIGAGSKPDLPPTDHQAMFKALETVTGLDSKFKRNAGKLAQASKELRDAGYSAADVERIYTLGGPWWSHDWRGQKNEHPTPATIVETIGKLKGPLPAQPPARAAPNGKQHPGMEAADRVEAQYWEDQKNGIDAGNHTSLENVFKPLPQLREGKQPGSS